MPPLKAVIVLILLLYSKAAKASCSNRFQSNFGDYSRGGFLHSTPKPVMESRVPLARNESQDLIQKAQPLLSNLVSNVTHRCVSTTWSLLRRAIDAIASRLGVTPAVNFEIVVDDGKGCCYPSAPPPNPTYTETKKPKIEINYGRASLNLSSGVRVLMLLLCTSKGEENRSWQRYYF